MNTFCDILSTSSSEKLSIELNGRELTLSRSTLNYSFYGLLDKAESDRFHYMAVLDKATSCSFIFGGLYEMNGDKFVFCECITDKIDEEIELHFILNESLTNKLHNNDIFNNTL